MAAKPPRSGASRADRPTGKGAQLNFKLELNCSCKPPVCPHAGPGIAKLLEAAYIKGRSDGLGEAVKGVVEAAARIGVRLEVNSNRKAPTTAPVRRVGRQRAN